MNWLIALAALAGALLLLTAILTVFFFCFAICRSDKSNAGSTLARMKKTMPPEHFALIQKGYELFLATPHEEVTITSRDGLRLHGLWFPAEGEARGTIILVHGWRSQPETDFSASFSYYREKGLNILAIHQRAHGKSEGKYICFGTHERYDLVDWANFADKKAGGTKKIIVSGISMGAATVMMALGESGLPKNLVAATADCGYTSAYDQFVHVLKRSYHLPPFPLLYTTDLLSRLVAKFPFAACRTEETLKNATVPVLFLHGLADDFVPPEHSRRSAAACASPHELWEIPEAGHGLSYLVDQATVSAALDAFIEAALREKS